jgi:TonB family protein
MNANYPTKSPDALLDALNVSASVPTSVPDRPRAKSVRRTRTANGKPGSGPLLSAILTTSLALHLLAVGLIGFGTPAEPKVPRTAAAAPPPPPPVVENIRLEAPPPPVRREILPQQSAPVAAQDAPAPATPIAAVAPSANVDFGVRVIGPVKLVSTLSEASGPALGTVVAVPHEVAARDLLVPALDYPAQALARRLSGKVVVEFHTTPRGDIVDPRVRISSGSPVLDRAALDNLRLGRWVGEAGYFTKTYEFALR